MVVLAKHIHNVKYVEGLLLSLNRLAPDINNAIKRINDAIDKLVDNHLNLGGSSIFEENVIKKEEGKDNIPLDTIIKILKEVKEFSSKNK